MKILLTGHLGQLGRAMQAALTDHDVTGWDVPDYDISHPATVDQVTDLAPDVVINVAAWTNVDGAEANPDLAFAANTLGPLHLAQGCARCGAALLQISTNEVFPGEAGRFYREYDPQAAKTVYARSKQAAETAIRQILDRVYIVRIAWLFGLGGMNFPIKIAQAADKFGALKVTADEFGNPTYAPDVAAAVAKLIRTKRYGSYHLVNDGYCSRFDLAQAVMALTGRDDVPLTPVSLAEWDRPASPPPHAVLINQAGAALGLKLRPWQEALAEYVAAEGGRFVQSES